MQSALFKLALGVTHQIAIYKAGVRHHQKQSKSNGVENPGLLEWITDAGFKRKAERKKHVQHQIQILGDVGHGTYTLKLDTHGEVK